MPDNSIEPEALPPFEVQYPPKSISPLSALFPAVGASLRRVAPERGAAFDKQTRGIVLSIVPVDRWLCQTQFGGIQVSTRALEITWAFCYATWVFYTRAVMGSEPSGEVIDLTSRADLQPALRLLDWAMSAMSAEHGPPWPNDLPRPSESTVFASDEHVATEMALVAVAFFLHHELAHNYLDPGGPEDELVHERACDEAAADWLLGVPGLAAQTRAKRAIGTAVGLLLITAYGVWTGRYDGVIHPFGFDRLIDVLETQVRADDSVVWAVVVAVLALHTTRARLPVPRPASDATFRDVANAYRDILLLDMTK
jgi:Peptidase U49